MKNWQEIKGQIKIIEERALKAEQDAEYAAAEQQREQARKSWEEGLATQDGNVGGKRKIG
jgi:hypothetical protein